MTTVLLVTFSKCQRIHSRQNIKLWRHRSISKCVKFYSWKGSWFWLFTNFGAKKNQGQSFAHKNRTCHIQIMDDSHLAINYLRRPRPCWAGVLFASMQYEQHIFHYQQLCNLLLWGGVFLTSSPQLHWTSVVPHPTHPRLTPICACVPLGFVPSFQHGFVVSLRPGFAHLHVKVCIMMLWSRRFKYANFI